MNMRSELTEHKVFDYFEQISRIPRGSGNMERISQYCIEFANEHELWSYRDDAYNVIIRKGASCGYESADPVILQGHLDMVCQKTETSNIDFENDGICVSEEGGYLCADGTTLGADNGIAVAMILAILADDSLEHPPIEAVFTTDEEIGMLGAMALDKSILKAKRMINIDSEDPEVVTVSCAGGSDFAAIFPLKRTKASGTQLTLEIKGLCGGHSGVEIDKGRVNANVLMGRFLHQLRESCSFGIVSIDGGDKCNAIPVCCRASLVSQDHESLLSQVENYAKTVYKEISSREAGFRAEISIDKPGEFFVIDSKTCDKLIYSLLLAPDGVIQMSAEIENLVETSLNMGILKTDEDCIQMSFALRSNKRTALSFLEERLSLFFERLDCTIKTGGHYPPWEYKNNSLLRDLYIEEYTNTNGNTPRTEAIHAGLECGVFASALEGLDCISIGPEMHDIHTVRERVSIRSTKDTYRIICDMLKKLK